METDEATGALDFVRWAELGLGALVLAALALFLPESGPVSGGVGADVATVGLFLVLPTVLALVGLVGALTDPVGIGSVLVCLLAAPTLFYALGSAYVVYGPPSGGGVLIGPLIAYGFAVLLAVAVVLRPPLNRTLAGLWSRPGVIG